MHGRRTDVALFKEPTAGIQTVTAGRGTSRVILPMLVLTLLVGCREPETTDTPAFRYHLESGPVTLDPALAGDVWSIGVIDRLFDGLMTLDRLRDTPRVELAESYEVSEDGLVYTFRLLPNARFHNGRSILASDVKYSWQRLLDRELESPNARFFELIEGAGDYRAGHAETVVGIQADDPHLLTVRLSQSFAPFLYHLASPAAGIVPKEEVLRAGEDFGRRPVGSGPFRFQQWQDTRLTLTAFQEHARNPPAVPRLIYEVADPDEALQRYQAGELDLVTELPTGSDVALRQTFSADFRQFPGSSWMGFCFRTDRQPFDDAKIRRAFALAIDRDALARELGELRHTPAVGFIPQGIPGHNPKTLTRGHGLSQARALLAEAGYPEGSGFPAQRFSTFDSEISQLIVDGIARLGIRASHDVMEFKPLIEGQRQGRLPWFLRGWAAEYPDPEPFLRPLFHSIGSDNLMAYSNPEVDRLLDAARAETDPTGRLELYRQAEALIIEDAPCVALYQSSQAVLLRSGWQGIPVGFFASFFEIELARWVGE